MADDQQSQNGAEAEKDETILLLGMIGVVDQQGTLIGKYRGGFLEVNPVLAAVGFALGLIPVKSQFIHNAIVTTM